MGIFKSCLIFENIVKDYFMASIEITVQWTNSDPVLGGVYFRQT